MNVVPQVMNLFKPRISESSELFKHARNCVVRLVQLVFCRWRPTSASTSGHCFVEAKNECSLTIQRTLRLLRSRTLDIIHHWQPNILVPCQRCLPISPLSFSSSDDLVCEPLEKVEASTSSFCFHFHFASGSWHRLLTVNDQVVWTFFTKGVDSSNPRSAYNSLTHSSLPYVT